MKEDVKTILVPVDFSDNSKKILGDAEKIAAKFGAKLSLIFVVQSFDDYSGFFVPHMPIAQFQDDLLTSARQKMANFVEDNLSAGAACATNVSVGDVAEEITSFAETSNADMIIMGTHGYRGVERILFGSVAEQVVKTAPCPVLTINPYK
jgi:nucleotide-binding universal stress UspA family protein